MDDLATQNDEVVSTEETAVEQSPQDFMREKFAEMKARDASTDPVDEAPKPAETEQQKAERARAPDGKFAKADKTTAAPGQTAQPAAQTAAQATNEAAAVPAVQATVLQPPTSYTPEGKAEFMKSSPAIQKEILKRENDFHQYYHKEVAPLKQAADYGKQIYQSLQPYEQTLRDWNQTPGQAIRTFFEFDRSLKSATPQQKQILIGNFAKGYGIDLSQGLPEQPQLDPNVEFLQRQNQQALQAAQQANQRIQQLEARQEQERAAYESAQLNNALEQVMQGKPHFNELKQSIGMIMQSAIGRNEDMTWDQAYEAAMWQSPKHRAQLLAKQQEDASAAAAQKRAEDANKAKAAKLASSVNVAKRGTLPAQGAVGNSQDFIREKLAEIRSR